MRNNWDSEKTADPIADIKRGMELFHPKQNIQKKDCPLCIRERIMPVIYEDNRFWITYCKDHIDCPLIVLKEHRDEFTGEERQWVEWFVSAVWPGTKRIRWMMRSIQDHTHCHVEL